MIPNASYIVILTRIPKWVPILDRSEKNKIRTAIREIIKKASNYYYELRVDGLSSNSFECDVLM